MFKANEKRVWFSCNNSLEREAVGDHTHVLSKENETLEIKEGVLNILLQLNILLPAAVP